jgi:hypothetical protein
LSIKSIPLIDITGRANLLNPVATITFVHYDIYFLYSPESTSVIHYGFSPYKTVLAHSATLPFNPVESFTILPSGRYSAKIIGRL